MSVRDFIKKSFSVLDIRHTLKQLRTTLDGSYDRILNTIPETYRRKARTALLLLAFSARPITLREVAEPAAVNWENQWFRPDDRLWDSRDILEICSSIVTLTDIGHDAQSLSPNDQEKGLAIFEFQIKMFRNLSRNCASYTCSHLTSPISLHRTHFKHSHSSIMLQNTGNVMFEVCQ